MSEVSGGIIFWLILLLIPVAVIIWAVKFFQSERRALKKRKITKDTGKAWGFITLVPFGWIFFIMSISDVRRAVLSGKISKEVGLAVIKNYMLGFWVVSALVALLFFANLQNSAVKGQTFIPNIFGIVIILLVWAMDAEKIEKFNGRLENEPKEDETFLLGHLDDGILGKVIFYRSSAKQSYDFSIKSDAVIVMAPKGQTLDNAKKMFCRQRDDLIKRKYGV